MGTWYVPLFNNLIGKDFCDNSGNKPKSMEPKELFTHVIYNKNKNYYFYL